MEKDKLSADETFRGWNGMRCLRSEISVRWKGSREKQRSAVLYRCDDDVMSSPRCRAPNEAFNGETLGLRSEQRTQKTWAQSVKALRGLIGRSAVRWWVIESSVTTAAAGRIRDAMEKHRRRFV